MLQRVLHARVEVQQRNIAEIGNGLLVLVAVEKNDNESKAARLLERLLGYRVFPGSQGKMNLSLADINGGLLLVPQFTLAADTRKGMRPGFSGAASPDLGQKLFNYLIEKARLNHCKVAHGQFGNDMQVSLTNDGPVTFYLQV